MASQIQKSGNHKAVPFPCCRHFSYQPNWMLLKHIVFQYLDAQLRISVLQHMQAALCLPATSYQYFGLTRGFISLACFRDAGTWTWHSTDKNISKSRSHFHHLGRKAMLSATQLICSQGVLPSPFCPQLCQGCCQHSTEALGSTYVLARFN